MAEETARTLIVLEDTPGSAGPRPAPLRSAAFLAHLLAARHATGEQRLKRRAAPARGAAAYRSGLDLPLDPPRRRIDRQS